MNVRYKKCNMLGSIALVVSCVMSCKQKQVRERHVLDKRSNVVLRSRKAMRSGRVLDRSFCEYKSANNPKKTSRENVLVNPYISPKLNVAHSLRCDENELASD